MVGRSGWVAASAVRPYSANRGRVRVMPGKFQDHCAYPPRMMNADRAAAYVDLSKTKFLEGVEKGIWRDVDGLPRWDRRDLDAAVDAMSDRKKKLSAKTSFDDVMGSHDGDGQAAM
jgi:hypothetical protein